MSANLWQASAATIKPDADGVYLSGKAGDLHCDITGTAALAENQTVHMGASLRGADAGYIAPYVGYMDAAGKKNWTGFPHWTSTGQWQRFEATCVVPSGMTIYEIGFNTAKSTGNIEVTNPVWSYGSPVALLKAQVTLAWSAGIVATTRYYQIAAPTAATPSVPTSSSDLGSWTDTEPTADVTKVLWTCERTVYADGTESWSKASKSTSYEAAKDAKSTATAAQKTATENSTSIKQLSDSITAEVTARTKTDSMVSEVSSRLTQTADGFSASIDRLSDTDRKVNSWFGFGADSSGNPQLTMGSSTSPVVGVYTNTGLAYRSRSGATLLELDGASRSSTMPHVHADDVSMGNWQMGPTQGGTHFTLQWIGG